MLLIFVTHSLRLCSILNIFIIRFLRSVLDYLTSVLLPLFNNVSILLIDI